MRKMVTIRKISAIESIPEADKICVYLIDGWKVVDSIGKYQVDDLVVFCEIDSFIPNSIAPFLTGPDKEPKEYFGVKGERLRSKRLRGIISQGLLLNIEDIDAIVPMEEDCGQDYYFNSWGWREGDDVSDILGIVKYEPPIPAQLAGQVKGNFPSQCPKTDQERIQNINLDDYKGEYEVTEKLEGSSCTIILDTGGNFEVCSRNLSLKEDENNSFWKAALHYGIREKMLELNLQGLALQGELVGEGIQGNIYNIKGVDYYIYDIYDTNKGLYLSSEERIKVTEALGLKHVPILWNKYDMIHTKESLLNQAEDFSKLNPKQQREGIVFKNINDPSKSFKAISNKYLLKLKD